MPLEYRPGLCGTVALLVILLIMLSILNAVAG